MTAVENDSHPVLKTSEREKLDVNISELFEGLKLNSSNIEVEESSKVTSTQNGDIDENVSEDGLIARGPCLNKFDRTKTVTHPYNRPCTSPYSDSTSPFSSQGSPPIIVEERRCSSGGAMTLGHTMISFLTDTVLENSQPTSSPNRHQYMHKAGGKMQVADTTTTVPKNPYLPVSVAKSPSNFSLSPASSPYDSNLNSVSTNESDSLDGLRFDNNSTESEWSPYSYSTCDEIPEDIEEFVSMYSTNNNFNDQVLYHKKVDEILVNLESSQLDTCKNPVLPITVLEEGKLIQEKKKQQQQSQQVVTQLNTSPNGTTPVVISTCTPQINRSQVTLVLVSSEVNIRSSRQQPRLIKPKVDVTPRIPSMVNKTPPLISNCCALRDSILSKYSDVERRKFHCIITKCTDQELFSVDDDGDTQLHIAIANKLDIPSVFLIDRFSNSDILDLNCVNHNMETPLFCAVHQQLPHLVEYLLARGADPNASCHRGGGTALHYAVKRGKEFLRVIEALATSPRIKIDCTDTSGRTPLHCAVENHGREISVDKQREIIDSLPCIRYLLRRGASVYSHENLGGKTAVHMALERKSLDILQLFYEVNNNVQKAVNKQNFSGHAPLHYVATMNDVSEREQVRFAQLLIKMGACVQATNREHKCPADLVDKDRKEVKQILLPNRQRNK